MRVAIALLPLEEPPVANCFYRKAGRVKAVSNTNKAVIRTHFIDAIGHCLANRVLRPVMYQHGLGDLAPGFAGILEVANQLFFSCRR